VQELLEHGPLVTGEAVVILDAWEAATDVVPRAQVQVVADEVHRAVTDPDHPVDLSVSVRRSSGEAPDVAASLADSVPQVRPISECRKVRADTTSGT
jgi:hypothetical protein